MHSRSQWTEQTGPYGHSNMLRLERNAHSCQRAQQTKRRIPSLIPYAFAQIISRSQCASSQLQSVFVIVSIARPNQSVNQSIDRKNIPYLTIQCLAGPISLTAESHMTVRFLSLHITHQSENFGGRTGFPANALGPGSDMEKYIFAAFVVPKS